MTVIRDEQMEDLARDVNQRRTREFAGRLRKDFSEPTAPMNDQQLIELVEQGCSNAHELEIFEKEDIYRFLKLNFLPPELLQSPFIQSVLIRVLNNFTLSGTKRLDFVEEHVVKHRAK
jgi:hypothetical protein